jgi:polysaccharide pyruvyl transferase WcaK-like protein
VELSILTIDPELTSGYFRTVRQVQLPKVFPKFLYDECPRHHGVVACEGSMFKSKFADALSTMMAGSLGMASAEGKLSVGYGAEAGAMTPALQQFVRTQCKQSLIICRNEPSRRILEGMGIRTRGGTDTAWTFEPAPLERGAQLLRDQGWDGAQPVLAVCPINPFWWPTRPDLVKALAHRLGGQFGAEHYDSIYFHEWTSESAEKYDAYLDAFATALNAYRREESVFPILVGSEMLDRAACEHLNERLERPVPLFVSDDHDMYDLVSVLRNCQFMASSRYHGIVTSMPGGVASVGVTMDERIENLLTDRGHPELLLRVDEPGLAEKLLRALRRVTSERERYADEVKRYVPGQIKCMGQMGMDFADEVVRVYPEFPLPERRRSWEHFVPRLSPALADLMGAYD